MPPHPGALRPRTVRALAVGFLTAALLACQPSTPSADTVFHNAVVITMDDGRPRADAMAVTGERIVGVGSFEEMAPCIGDDTDVHDLGGRTVLPGIHESHIHVRDLGFQQHYAVNLEAAQAVADVQHMLGKRMEALREAGEH